MIELTRLTKEGKMINLGRSRELAQRSNDGVDVTLRWYPEADVLRVCVCDGRSGAYFEIHPEPYLALDVYYHPYAYIDFSEVHYEDQRLAA
ncbi:MAG: hypothetical protein ACJ76I_09610 [Gaiellaceae bacterium]